MTPYTQSLFEMPGHLIRRLNQHSTAVFQQCLKAEGIDLTSVQYSTLETLAEESKLDQASIAARIAYDRATIGGVVKRLEEKQLIKRQQNAADKRAFQLVLTAQGAALLERVRPIVAALQQDILSNLSAKERRQLTDLMQRALQRSED